MLKTSEIKILRQVLRQAPPGDELSAALGSSYSELTETLKARYGIALSPRSLRYYVNKMRKDDSDWHPRPLNRGRPKKVLTGSDALVQAVSTYLMQVSGYSASVVYQLLRSLSEQQWPPMGKVSFHKLHVEDPSARQVLQIEPSKVPLTYCCLVLGQVRLTPPEAVDEWLLLFGIEATTSYANFQLINLLPTDPLPKPQKGRPKQPSHAAVAQQVEDGDILLPATILHAFVSDCQRRLCLPVKRVIMPDHYPMATRQFLATETSLLRVDSGAPSMILPTTAMTALPEIAQLQESLERATRQHYRETARAYVSALRRTFREQVEALRAQLSTTKWHQSVRKSMPEAAALDDFYSTEPAFNVRTIYQQHPVIRLRYKKTPGEPGESG